MNRGLLNMMALFTKFGMNCHCCVSNGVRHVKYVVLWDFLFLENDERGRHAVSV